MSDAREELRHLRQDVDRVKERLPARGSKRGRQPGMGDVLEARVREARAKSGESVAFGVARIAVYANTLGAATSDHTGVWTGPIRELPSEDQLRASATALANPPFQMRAMHRLFSPLYDGQPMQMTKAALAAAMGVDGPTLERELAPLVDKKTLRQFKTTEGEDAYELKRWDLFLMQLSLAGQCRRRILAPGERTAWWERPATEVTADTARSRPAATRHAESAKADFVSS